MTDCLTRSQIERLLVDQLDLLEERRLEAHLRGCIACQQVLERLSAPTLHLSAQPGAARPNVLGEGFARLLASNAEWGPRFGGPSGATPHIDGMTPPFGTPGPFGPCPGVPGYTLLDELGSGGRGVVYRAFDLKLKRQVALKMIAARPRPIDLARFRREAEAVSRLQHPNVVQIFDYGEAEGRPYLSMELVEGCTLEGYAGGVPQPPAAAADLVRTLAGAVQAIHECGIIHRDLKPANILLRLPPGEDPAGDLSALVPKVTDFGLAKDLTGDGLTATGDVIGTPRYMAPEQAQQGQTRVGPATDVYALGAILYELLTGRPPFRDVTPVETLVRVLYDDPVPPRQVRAGVSADLETICLKCLNKDPARRYATARELADDIGRFLADEPIRARPAGRWERTRRCVRRHPVWTAALAGCLMLGLGLAGGGLWLDSRQVALAGAVDDDLREADRLRDGMAWAEAGAAVERAKGRLGTGGPSGLRRRVEAAARTLDHARRDGPLVARADSIRLGRATHAEGHFDHAAARRFADAQAVRAYEAAFRDAGFEEYRHDPAAAAAWIRESAVREALVSGVDDWAVCTTDRGRQDWLLAVARLADPDPWRDRVRDPAAWRDGAALAELARTAPVADQPPPLLVALGERLQAAGGDAVGLLRRVIDGHPADFWAHFTLGRVLQERGDCEEAIECYRQAVKVRPAAAAYNNLGLALYTLRKWDAGSVDYYQKALAANPGSAAVYNNLGLTRKAQGPWPEATSHYLKALELDPGSAPAHCNLGAIRAYSGGIDDAIGHYREAVRLDPGFARSHYLLGVARLAKVRFDVVHDNSSRVLGTGSRNRQLYGAACGMSLNYALVHYHRAVDLAPEWTVTPSGLGPTRQDRDRLDEAIGHYRRALEANPRYAPAEAALGQALLALGRFTEARDATRRGLGLLDRKAFRDEPGRVEQLPLKLTAQLERCERLLDLDRRLPAVIRGADKPADATEWFEFAGLCGMTGRYAAAARLYAASFAADPKAATDPLAHHNYRAACAAALAGCGLGSDAAELGEAELANWRRQAREWLRTELRLVARMAGSGSAGDRFQADIRLVRWWTDPDLGVLCEPDVLAQFPPAECDDWAALWDEFVAHLVLVGKPPADRAKGS